MSTRLSQYQATIVLNALSGIGPATCRRLREKFGEDLSQALSADMKTLATIPGITKLAAEKLITWEKLFDLKKEEEKIKKSGAEFLAFSDERFPPLLKMIPDAPLGIYVLGSVPAVKTTRAFAIVGTRKASLYGTSVAQRISEELSQARWTIVSGLARGIDTAAHIGAIEGGSPTIAVLGCGVDIVYPPENIRLYKKIIETGGAIISEFPFGRSADRYTFPQRNRIIAGMSSSMLVVESDEKGGSMISADFAAECGRTVFAVPGRIDQINSKGCHKLIREGATLVTSAEDIIEELEGTSSQPLLPLFPDQGKLSNNEARNARIKEILAELPQDAAVIFGELSCGDAIPPDVITSRTGLSSSSVSSNLLLLELERLVARRADGCYEKTII